MSRLLSRAVASRCLCAHFSSAQFAISRAYSGSGGTGQENATEPSHPNLNEHITRFFEKKAEFHLNTKAEDPSHFKYIGYNKAANWLKTLPRKINSGKEAIHKDAISARLAKKIDEIIKTGTLRSATDERLKSITDLLRVVGIYYNDAKRLCAKGITSIDDLRRNTRLLSNEQKKALEYLELTEMEIPKSEVEMTESVLRTILSSEVDSNLTIEPVFPGNMPIIGMDFIITHPDFSDVTRRDKDVLGPIDDLLQKVVNALKKTHLIKENFAPKEKYRFVGLLRLRDSDTPRLIRLHLVTNTELPVARAYLSKAPMVPRKIKERILEAGYHITMYGLKKPGEEMIPVQSEEELLDLIGMKCTWNDEGLLKLPFVEYTLSRLEEEGELIE